MYLTPQSTTALKNMQFSKVINALELAKIGGALQPLSDGVIPKEYNILAVMQKNTATQQIPPFTQPTLLNSGEIVLDLRGYWSQISQSVENGRAITNGPAKTLIDLAQLMRIWTMSPYARSRLLTLGDLPIHTYSYWVGEGIARTISADPITQREIVELAAWFYQCQFQETKLELTEDYVYKIAGKIARITWSNIETVVSNINRVGQINTLAEFATAVVGLQSLRTDKVNAGLIVTTLVGSWFGSSSAKETAAVALEYPPAFLAMLHSACNDAFFRKSPILEIARRADKRGKFEEFNRVYANVLFTIRN